MEVDKIFASPLKSKLSTTQKNAKKWVEKKNKKASKKYAKQAYIDAKMAEGGNNFGAPLVPHLDVLVVSSPAETDASSPTSTRGIPLPITIGPPMRRRATRLQARLTSRREC